MRNRYPKALLNARARQNWFPGSGVEQSQGDPYSDLPPSVRENLQIPADPGITVKGWENPYRLTFYPVQVPDQATDPSIQAIAGNLKRCYLIIQNYGPGNLFINFGQACNVNGTNCLTLIGSQVYEQIGGGGVFPDRNSILVSSFVARDPIFVLADQPGTTAVIGEGVWNMPTANL